MNPFAMGVGSFLAEAFVPSSGSAPTSRSSAEVTIPMPSRSASPDINLVKIVVNVNRR
ncbi:hypothetical protein [Novosphingobium sp.]|uniref:hypothetical protein n=1 Tax=Novosphingobium sp. TaxID=1874826 RepID=UPI003D6CC6D2